MPTVRAPPCGNCGHRHGDPGAPFACPPRRADRRDAPLPPWGPSGTAIPPPRFLGEEAPKGSRGTATTQGRNCLIRAIWWLVSGEFDSSENRPARDAACRAIRTNLAQVRGCPPGASPDISEWWAPAIHAIGVYPSAFTAPCSSRGHASGAKMGNGPTAIHILDEGNLHLALSSCARCVLHALPPSGRTVPICP